MSDLDRLLRQVEELKQLATRQDESWMNSMSTEELQALGKRVRKVADGLNGLQGKLGAPQGDARRGPASPQRGGFGSFGTTARRGAGPTRPAPSPGSLSRPSGAAGGAAAPGSRWSAPPASRPVGTPAGQGSGMDLGSPLRRRVGGSSAPQEQPRPAPPASAPQGNPYNPFSKPLPPPAPGKRGRIQF